MREDFFRLERVGKRDRGRVGDEEGKSSPRRHCPQKAVVAQVATVMSRGDSRLRCCRSCVNILELMGGRGGRLEPRGVRLWTPLSTYRKRELPFHSRLWAICHALRADRRFLGVLRAWMPMLDAAKAHSMNSSAGNLRWLGTPSALQKRIYC